ncbi:MAG: ribosome small subunit-dependent GTPase A [Ignavibacteriaceae bacterium]
MSRIESKDYYLFKDGTDELVRCSLKGKFKKEFNLKKDKLYHTDIVVVGDTVEYDLNDDGTGVIHKIEKRRNYLSRKAPRIRGASYRGERLEQIVASNVDTLFIVSSTLEPPFNNKTVDRFLVTAESSGIEAKIIINKNDVDGAKFIKTWAKLYKNIGYEVFLTSAKTGEGIKKVFKTLKGKKNLFWGQSGVGKSSLLNEFYPGLNLQIGAISTYTDRGTHTTVTSIMINAGKDTYIIDTPGVREIDPFGVRKEDLGHYFIEFADYLTGCRFNTCTHHHEPGCEVINAVKAGDVSLERYESYIRILETIEDDIHF